MAMGFQSEATASSGGAALEMIRADVGLTTGGLPFLCFAPKNDFVTRYKCRDCIISIGTS